MTAAKTHPYFVVLADSVARLDENASIHGFLHDLRRRLVDKGVLVTDGEHLRFAHRCDGVVAYD